MNLLIGQGKRWQVYVFLFLLWIKRALLKIGSGFASKMTKKPLGAALHLDNDRLKGIVTEGDLRKSIASTSDLSNSILDFINNNPISINPSISILDAMKVMEDRHSQISCLPVINSDGKCLGLVTLHDLYQTKLV